MHVEWNSCITHFSAKTLASSCPIPICYSTLACVLSMHAAHHALRSSASRASPAVPGLESGMQAPPLQPPATVCALGSVLLGSWVICGGCVMGCQLGHPRLLVWALRAQSARRFKPAPIQIKLCPTSSQFLPVARMKALTAANGRECQTRARVGPYAQNGQLEPYPLPTPTVHAQAPSLAPHSACAAAAQHSR